MSQPKDMLRTEIGERVEQSDFNYAAQTSQRHLVESLFEDLIIGDATSGAGQPQNSVIDGFATTKVGTVVTVAGGKAVIGMREGGTAEFGMLLGSGATSRNLDMTALADGTYGVYVRAEFRDDRFLNRLFWNALAVTPVETPRSIATRRTEDWNMTIELVSPGPEWMLIAQAVKAGASVTLTDLRSFLLEGNLAASYIPADSEWGGGNDRNNDRALYGVKSLRRLFRAVQKQMGTAIDSTDPRWWQTISLGLKQMVALDGSRSLTGNLKPDNTVTRDLGSSTKLFNAGYFSSLFPDWVYAGISNLAAATSWFIPRFQADYATDGGVERTLIFESDARLIAGGAGPDHRTIQIWRSTIAGLGGQTDMFELTTNAFWDNAVHAWAKHEAGFIARKLEWSRAGLYFVDRASGSAGTWDDDLTPTGWDENYSVFGEGGTFSLSGALSALGIAAFFGTYRLGQGAGELTPAALGGNTDNYNPAGLSTCNVIRQDASNDWNLTGLSALNAGTVIMFCNISTSKTITLTHEDGASTAARRFRLPNNGNLALGPNSAIPLYYDSVNTRWRVLA